MASPMRVPGLSGLISSSAAGLRLAWRQAAQFDDVAVMHITVGGEAALLELARVLEEGSEQVLAKMLSIPPWSGNEGGADAPVSLLIALERALSEAVAGEPSLTDAVDVAVRRLAAGIDSAARDRLRVLEERVAIDLLTGAMSRAAVLDQLDAESARAVRHATRLSVVYMDVDGLKRANDERGHAAGDVLLRRLVDVVRENTRAADRLGRLGGDEFLLVLPETDLEGARFVAGKIKRVLAESGVNVTCGVAGPPETGPSPEALIAAADASMRDARAMRG